MTAPKEDQQPMTTREELVALADELSAVVGEAILGEDVAKQIAAALRLASRQEVSVEELADFLYDNGVIVVSDDEEEGAARALLAEYSITKRTTEG